MKSYGICLLTLIPVRKEPSERSEMVSQLLFGETFDILEEQDGWSSIKTHFDQYPGWITTKMATILDLEGLKKYQKKAHFTLKEAVAKLSIATNQLNGTILGGGSIITDEIKESVLKDSGLNIENQVLFHEPYCIVDTSSTARKFINAPYLWGGRTIFGIDCSGLTQVVFKMNGITLPRDAFQQAELGATVPSVKDSRPGDLAFFERNDGHIIHTGIICENSEIIHASGKVRIDKIDDDGIYNFETGKYTHKLKLIKRIP